MGTITQTAPIIQPRGSSTFSSQSSITLTNTSNYWNPGSGLNFITTNLGDVQVALQSEIPPDVLAYLHHDFPLAIALGGGVEFVTAAGLCIVSYLTLQRRAHATVNSPAAIPPIGCLAAPVAKTGAP